MREEATGAPLAQRPLVQMLYGYAFAFIQVVEEGELEAFFAGQGVTLVLDGGGAQGATIQPDPMSITNDPATRSYGVRRVLPMPNDRR